MALGACSSASKNEQSTERQSPGTASEEMAQPQTAPQALESREQGTVPRYSKMRLQQEMTLNELHHMNQKEIQMAQMAQDKAQSPQVKSRSQQIMADHERMDQKVQQVAQSKNVELQKFQPSTSEKAVMEWMSKLSGSDFDQAYAANMEHGHREAVAHLRLAKSEKQDPEVKRLIDAALPKMQQHAKMGHSMERSAKMEG